LTPLGFLRRFAQPELFSHRIAHASVPRGFYVPANISTQLPPRYPFSSPPEQFLV
jgi:hypothetical protein